MKLLDCEQGAAEWFSARRGVPTASEFNRIITAKTCKLSASADEYIAELIDELVHPDTPASFGGNRHTERGHELEPKARAWYQFVTGYDVKAVGFVLADDEQIGCSPDALIWDEGWIGGLEAKAPEGKKHVRWMMGGTLPDEHKQQVHGSLVVTGLPFWDFISYCPGYKPFRVRVTPDEYTKMIADALGQFADRLAAAKEQFVEYLPDRAA